MVERDYMVWKTTPDDTKTVVVKVGVAAPPPPPPPTLPPLFPPPATWEEFMARINQLMEYLRTMKP